MIQLLIPVNTLVLFLLSWCFFILALKSRSLKSFISRLTQMRLLLPMFSVVFSVEKKRKCLVFSVLDVPMIMPMMKTPKGGTLIGSAAEVEKMSLLDLPELAMECILERLSPAELCIMAGVCTYLRDQCRSDRLWEKHMKPKWGRVIGKTAYGAWQWHMAANKRRNLLDARKHKALFGSISSIWPLRLVIPWCGDKSEFESSLPVDSIMALYLSLENGKFWFPAQVYNRENGHAGFILSCYDAKLSYNSRTNTFQARYSPHGQHATEENISWDRLRAPPVDTPAYVLHGSDCLDDLKPGDHFEIQWRRNKDYPYGWWYGVVGHLESCDGHAYHCNCQNSELVMLEFNQYAPDSRWRRTTINRKSHHEKGNEADGFYGGIRKLYDEEEISTWKGILPAKVLD